MNDPARPRDHRGPRRSFGLTGRRGPGGWPPGARFPAIADGDGPDRANDEMWGHPGVAMLVVREVEAHGPDAWAAPADGAALRCRTR